MKSLIIAGVAMGALFAASAVSAAPDWDAVAKALGKSGAMQPGGIYKVSFPRTDLKVTLDGAPVKPGFGLGGWIAFEPMGDQAMAMGDLVLTHAEVNPVMSKLEQAGFQITALHNHLLRSEPATMYMHVEGHGDPVKLAAALHDALSSASKTPFAAAPAAPAAAPAADIGLDVAAIDQALGAKGKVNGGILQYSVPRKEQITSGGMAVPPPMGTATAINFEPLGAGRAAITGDFVLIASEVNPVIKALRAHGIEVTAVHNHMLNDEPRIFFMHFWGQADAKALAEGLGAALKQTNVQ
jgi:biotin operon repressor